MSSAHARNVAAMIATLESARARAEAADKNVTQLTTQVTMLTQRVTQLEQQVAVVLAIRGSGATAR